MSHLALPVLWLLLYHGAGGNLVQMGPTFVLEPPSLVQYAGSTGARVPCVARGDPPPRVTWLGDDGAPLADITGLRWVHGNGTLEVAAQAMGGGGGGGAGGGGYRGTQPSSYRCRAANAHGTILSRDVTLQPVSEEAWEAVSRAPPATEGGVAAVWCSAASGASAPGAVDLAPLVDVAVWYRDDQLVNSEPPHPGSRHLVAGNALLIRDVRAEDSASYSCLARHRVTGATKRSRPAHLAVSPGSLGSAPRLIGAQAEGFVAAGADLCIPCVAQGHPSPRYTWYREAGGRLTSWSGDEHAWLWSGGAALCVRRAQRQDGGAWLCKPHNLYGDVSAQLRLTVRETLTVHVQPPVQVADTGSTVRFNCTVSDEAVATRWLHDGVPVGGGARELLVHGVARAHRGMYQCVARRGHDSAQAAAELRLGDTAPELHYTFIEQALRAGGPVSLRCAASGSPPPRFTWLLDNQPIDQYLAAHRIEYGTQMISMFKLRDSLHVRLKVIVVLNDEHRTGVCRYSVNEQTSLGGDVVSVLNVSAAAADGGRYTCRAHNTLGHGHHSARLNIYGPPSIRALGPVRVVAGANATVYCPYAGYPISSIAWWRRGERGERALEGAGRVSARGAELRFAPALVADAGVYACAVTAPDGTAARRDIDVQVRNPPKISPFIFSPELTEGSSVQILCGVSSGDKPLYFSWLKDGAPIPTSLQIQEKSLDEFSFLMFSDVTARHSGEYTCRVANHAATVNYTATLSVKVTPSWSLEPTDTAVLLGASLALHCAARGSPQPRLAWYRKIGEGVVGSDGTTGEQWEELTHGLEWGGAAETNGSLLAAAAARAHQGVYRCRADNGVGPPLVKHVNVTVHEPAHFGGSGGARNVSCVRGAGATLTCDVLGDAPIRVHWTHRARRIDYDTYRVSVSEARTADGLLSILTLPAAERGDAGEYRCHAENAYGRSEALLYLIVQEPPETPRALHLGGAGGRWARVVWRAGHAGGAQTLLYRATITPLHARDERPRQLNLTAETLTPGTRSDEPDGKWGARLEGLRPATEYSLRLSAANHVGVSPDSEPLVFTTLEEGPSGPPLNVRVRAAGAGELHVSWAAPEPETWNGELLGYVVSWRSTSDSEEAHGSLTAAGWGSSELTVSGLRKYAQYALTVKAYNSVGAGPPSPAVFATTAEGVPEAPPQDVRCEALSSRVVRVRWQPPPPAARAGMLRGYDVLYEPHETQADNLYAWGDSSTPGGGGETARVGANAGAAEATLQGLRRAANYSIVVRARTDAGAGVPSAPLYCATLEDVPGGPADVKALVRGSDGVVVTWLPPAQRNGKLTHYTLYTREAGKSGKEWSQRVEASELGARGEREEREVSREVRGLRERQLYEFWVTAATASGAGVPSHIVTAAPSSMVPARIASFGGWVRAAAGARVRLRCTALGAPPLVRAWAPIPAPRDHTLADSGDLIIHRAERALSGNYTCRVRNALGADSVTYALRVLLTPTAPALRLVRAAQQALHLAWDAPADGGAPIQGYTLWWRRADTTEEDARSNLLPAGETTHALEGLACGTAYKLTLRAHNAVGPGAHSQELLARTRGDKAKAASGKEFVWSNSTHLRLNLLAWVGGRCPVSAWSVWVRGRGDGGEWQAVRAAGEAAEAGGLAPGTWYDIRVLARSPAGDTAALYRVPTATSTGERIGDPAEMPLEASDGGVNGSDGDGSGADAAWRAGAGPALLGGGAAAALLAVLLVALLLWRHKRPRHRPACLRRAHSVQEVRCTEPRHRRDTQQLYTTEPGKRNGKIMTPPDDLHEISPYATFSMAEGGGGGSVGSGPPVGGGGVTRCGSGCLLHLRTFGRGEPLDMAAPPSRPNLLRHPADDYGRSKGRSTRADTDSESSGSPCAECASKLYRLPHDADTLPAVESSAEEASSCGVPGGARGAARGRRRRDHTRHPSAGTARYFSSATLQARHQAL